MSTECENTFNHKLSLTLCRQAGPTQGLPRCTWPYCNDRIIAVIWTLFFSSANISFAMHNISHFTIHNEDGSLSYEVPMPLISLVATGVSWRTLGSKLHANFFSYMLHSMSGGLGEEFLSTLLPIPSLTFMRGTCKHSSTSWTGGRELIIKWCKPSTL